MTKSDPTPDGDAKAIEWSRFGGDNSCFRHGDAVGGEVTAEYRLWSNMRRRCGDPASSGYRKYGARGIRVCAEWQDDFRAFLAHVGRRPSPGHSLDRIDNSRGYEPGNVRWATATEQARNSSLAKNITHDGKTQCIAAWAKEAGMSMTTLSSRLCRGLSLSEAMSKPVKNCGKRSSNGNS